MNQPLQCNCWNQERSNDRNGVKLVAVDQKRDDRRVKRRVNEDEWTECPQKRPRRTHLTDCLCTEIEDLDRRPSRLPMPPGKPAGSWRMLVRTCRGNNRTSRQSRRSGRQAFGSADRPPSEGRAGEGHRGLQAHPPPERRMGRMRRQQRPEARTRPMPRCCASLERSAAQLPQRELRARQQSTTKEGLFQAPEDDASENRDQPKALQSTHK